MSHSLSKKFTFGSLLMFALPTTIMMMVMSLYTIVDGVSSHGSSAPTPCRLSILCIRWLT